MTQHQEIIAAFQMHGNAMTLGQILKHSFGYEFRARKVEINRDDPDYQIRFAKKGEKPSENLYVLERKFKPVENGQINLFAGKAA